MIVEKRLSIWPKSEVATCIQHPTTYQTVNCLYTIRWLLLCNRTYSTHKDVKPRSYINTRTSFEEMRPDIQSINENLRYTFLSGNQKNIKWRKRQFDKVKKFLLENQKEIIDCVVADFGRFCRTNCTKYV
jgi:hypothetical protein